jgi:D-alanyl-D-alanine carboxypeptidase
MMDDCREEGLEPLICSSYRTVKRQEELYQKKVREFQAQGLAFKAAEEEAARVVALPGTSEHHLGLAVDIVDMNYQQLDTHQETTKVQKWLKENSWRYGFILRYPTDKTDITGIVYEPWHYRYVGKEAAAEIYEQGICLEEYLENQKI